MKPTPSDLWTFARVYARLPVSGELDALSEPFRAIGAQLTGLAPEARQAALEEFLKGRDDQDEIILALAGIDPEGPPPGAAPGEASAATGKPGPEPSSSNYRTLHEGTWVRALDRDNYGEVVADLGDRASVHFTAKTGHEATVTLHKVKLSWPDGRHLMEPPPERPGEPPVAVLDGRFATLADYARIAEEQRWLWDGWIARGVFNAVASDPGTGKTRFGLDLARRLHHALPWPDGQPNELPEGTRTLWVQGDRAFPEMLEAARAFGLPDEAVALGSSPEDPTGSLDLDDPDTLAALAERIKTAAPALVVIDTVGMTTGRNLCRPEDARSYFGPLMDLAASSGVAFLGLTHLSKDKEALGRRIVEKARVVAKMTQPDPDGQPNRRKLWVDKTAAVNPPALGITMGDAGNEYDTSPPTEAEPNRGGRPPEKREKARLFIIEALTRRNDRRAKEICSEWEEAGESDKAFWGARDVLVKAGELTCEGKPVILHLILPESEPNLDPA